MINAGKSGKVIDFVAPSGGVVSGTPVLIGAILVIPVASAVAGETFAGELRGQFTLAKASGAITAGAAMYWDDTAKNVTTTSNTGANKLVGFAPLAAASGDTTVDVVLNGTA
jgi:predicted RecA/RadA family phage recombinase